MMGEKAVVLRDRRTVIINIPLTQARRLEDITIIFATMLFVE